MTVRKPIVLVDGGHKQLPEGDQLPRNSVSGNTPPPNKISSGGLLGVVSTLLPAGATLSSFTSGEAINLFPGLSSSSAGKFIRNSSTFGGTQAALAEPVESLIIATGRVTQGQGGERTSGHEFYVASITGEGAANSEFEFSGYTFRAAAVIPGYLSPYNNGLLAIDSDEKTTVGAWVRAIGGATCLGRPQEYLQISERLYSKDTIYTPGLAVTLLPEEGWVFLQCKATFTAGTLFPIPGYISKEVGASVEIAFPTVVPGYHDLGMPKAPSLSALPVSLWLV